MIKYLIKFNQRHYIYIFIFFMFFIFARLFTGGIIEDSDTLILFIFVGVNIELLYKIKFLLITKYSRKDILRMCFFMKYIEYIILIAILIIVKLVLNTELTYMGILKNLIYGNFIYNILFILTLCETNEKAFITNVLLSVLIMLIIYIIDDKVGYFYGEIYMSPIVEVLSFILTNRYIKKYDFKNLIRRKTRYL